MLNFLDIGVKFSSEYGIVMLFCNVEIWYDL